MKIILPWLLAVCAVGGSIFFYNAHRAKVAELAQLQPQIQELELLRLENEELKRSQLAPDELARLQESKAELLRLRNEVRQLRTDKTQLGQQAQAAQTAAQRAQAEVQTAQAQAEAVATERAAAILAARQAATDPAVVNACLNHLRQIDTAKQQWALENNKPAEAQPTEPEIAVYLKGEAIPACPAGGTYALGNLRTAPVCSSSGHVLPPPAQ